MKMQALQYQEVIDNAKAEYGLDQHIPCTISCLVCGNGNRIWERAMCLTEMSIIAFISKLPATMMLTLSSILLTIVLAIPLGILSAVKHNKWVDYLIRF